MQRIDGSLDRTDWQEKECGTTEGGGVVEDPNKSPSLPLAITLADPVVGGWVGWGGGSQLTCQP